jgi:hypothetical protein
MYIKLKDPGTVFQETGQRKVVKGTNIVEVKNSEPVERARRNGVIVEVSKEDYEAQEAANKAAANAKTAEPVAVTVVPAGGAVGNAESPEEKQKREEAEKQAQTEREKNPQAKGGVVGDAGSVKAPANSDNKPS